MKTKYFIMMAAVALGLSSCQKKFDPSSYAPDLNIGGYTSSKQVAATNLVAYWAFDGSLIDSVTNTNGTNTGTTFGTGVKGKSLQGGTDKYFLSVPSAKVLGLKSFTINEWVNTPPPSNGIIALFSLSNKSEFWGNLEIFIENGSTNLNGTLKFVFTNNGTGDKTYAVANVVNFFDKWNALAVSYDETTSMVKVYVNGSRVSAGTLAGITGPLNFVNSGNLVFGTTQFMTTPSQTTSHSNEPWASFLTGQLDEVKIFNKALSDAEIGSIAKLEGRGK
ncbi:LamG domain-containing protein [Pedobacter sp. MR2016-19]|uniref:LamG domain-containing protein n=1 Tax=Pedobacter sp. MR2016-19 TaxID=2780089 RepID=UPI001874DD35|nr:LamG domain-containing protein [Pedobacter sp. MR2016-19]MBE5322270.1 LamG domain-containing protein [Pedobacter sp. MR2016-19]